MQELPPRARRIHGCALVDGFSRGTTSACAENTELQFYCSGLLGNYLRVRGEYGRVRYSIPDLAELPPRARRIPAQPKPLR